MTASQTSVKESTKRYSLLEYIRKGKAHKHYKFSATHKQTLVTGVMSCPDNPCDRHTLNEQLEQLEQLTGFQPEQCIVDKNYRGVEVKDGTAFVIR